MLRGEDDAPQGKATQGPQYFFWGKSLQENDLRKPESSGPSPNSGANCKSSCILQRPKEAILPRTSGLRFRPLPADVPAPGCLQTR